jgi:predicted lipoprotein with Yx(FWY)xxD motif
MRHHKWLPAAFAVFAVAMAALLAACGGSSGGAASSASTSAAPAASSAAPAASNASGQVAMLKTSKTSLGSVLTNSTGFTLYWFAIDTPTSSKCTGSCATYWPPVIGTPKAASGVTLSGKLGTITRSDGSVQATYNGHPLYTYAGDKSPGQTSGNKLNASGGLWYAVTLSAAASSSASTSSGSSGGGGGGY